MNKEGWNYKVDEAIAWADEYKRLFMLEDYETKGKEVQEQLEQAHEALNELVEKMVAEHPEEERTYRMGVAMNVIYAVNSLVKDAATRLARIEWPTEERPR